MLAVLNDRTADGRDISWVWDADFELLAGRVRARDLRGHARRRAGAAAEVRRRAGRAAARRARAAALRSTRRWPAPADGRLFALPTYTALLELREELAAAGTWRSSGSSETARQPMSVIWHDLECGGYREDLPLWRALADRAGGPVLDVGAGTGRVALDLARAGHEVDRARP